MPEAPDGEMYVHHRQAARTAPERGDLWLEHATIADREHLGATRRATHAHDVYHLILYTQGRGSFLLHDQVVPLAAPYLVLTAPGHAHSFQGGPEEDAVYSELTFRGRDRQGRTLLQGWPELLSSRIRHPCLLPAHGPVSAPAARELLQLIARIVEQGFAAAGGADALIQADLEQVLLVLCRHQYCGRADLAGDAVERARLLLEDSGGERLDATRLAGAVALSAKHLARAFKRRFGLPPVQYRRRWAMQQAATLIRSTPLPLQDIAQRLGFHDPAYFSRVFRVVHGDSPLRYRQRQRASRRLQDP